MSEFFLRQGLTLLRPSPILHYIPTSPKEDEMFNDEWIDEWSSEVDEFVNSDEFDLSWEDDGDYWV